MTENTVPRVARFADLRVGMTIERVITGISGTQHTTTGDVAKLLAHIGAYDSAGDPLYYLSEEGGATLRILADPTPKLPTAPGTVITCTLDGAPGAVLVLDRDGDWSGVDAKGFCTSVYTSRPGDITDWTVVYDPTDAADAPTADPLDESDHRDRIDKHGHRVVRVGIDQWNNCGDALCGGKDLAWWSDCYGPLRFADEVTA